jgi:hypothetical protein
VTRLQVGPQIVADARAAVHAWIEDDHEMPVPDNDFGRDLHHAIKVLLQVTQSGVPANAIAIAVEGDERAGQHYGTAPEQAGQRIAYRKGYKEGANR